MSKLKYKLIYTDDLPDHVGGRCEYPWFPKLGTCVVKIRPKYQDDIGILKHELVHVDQYSRSWLHTIKRTFSTKYLYEIEIEAYTEQLKAYNYTDVKQAEWITDALLNKYFVLGKFKIKMSKEDVMKRLASIIKDIQDGKHK